jgi:hypothetical protein
MNKAVIHQRRRAFERLCSALRAALPRPSTRPDWTPHPAGSPAGSPTSNPAGSPTGSRAASPAAHRHQDATAVLTATRSVIRRGWTQNTWYVTQTPAGRRRTVQSIFPSRLDRSQVVEACLVGAVLHAAWQQSPRPEHAYPAIDALWQTLLGGGDAAGTGPVGPLSAPPVRVARVRDLTTWNDRHYRTRDEVLELLDHTLERIADADRRTDLIR